MQGSDAFQWTNDDLRELSQLEVQLFAETSPKSTSWLQSDRILTDHFQQVIVAADVIYDVELNLDLLQCIARLLNQVRPLQMVHRLSSSDPLTSRYII